MGDNPYSIAANRYFRMFLGIAGAFAFALATISCISSGRAHGPGRMSSIIREPYTAAADPSQFWLLIVFYAVMSVFFAALAWRAYRE